MYVYSLIFNLRRDLNVNDTSTETLCVEIINQKSKNTLVNTQCREPAGQIKQYEKYLKNIFQKTKKADRQLNIQGDLNLNLLDYHTCAKVNKYLNLLFQHSFIPAVTRPTRIFKNNSTLQGLF